ncbi:MAG: hypothetical protein ACK5LE_06830 [Alphaproteobacteria bacterium]
MRKTVLFGTTILAGAFVMNASAHVRDGLVDTSPTNFELTILGEVSAYQAFTSIDVKDNAGNDVLVDSYFGQNYSADIDFNARTHMRDWNIGGIVELDYLSNDEFSIDELYLEFQNDNVGMFRLGLAPSPSDELSLEVDLPGENYDDDRDFGKDIRSIDYFSAIGNSRFADDANQISYYSPKFGNMFQFGVAYIFGERDITENIDTSGNVIGVSTYDSLDHDGLSNKISDDAVEVAAKFENTWGQFDFAVSGAYRYYFDNKTSYVASDGSVWSVLGILPESQWTTGLQLGYGGFDWITTYGETYYADIDAKDWGVRTGFIYSWDRWQVGAAYELGVDGQKSDDTLKTQLVEASLSLQVFDGMLFHTNIGYAWSDFDKNSALADYDASAFEVRTGIDLSW